MQKTRPVKELDKNIPFDKISVKMLRSLDYGMDIQLDKNFSLSKHSEEDMIDIFHTETWTNLYAVSWNCDIDSDDFIEFERVYHIEETY
tara:strand:+ start:61 stop:327 length:267 start_codon:yes stop_codon:yes gene_type:complete